MVIIGSGYVQQFVGLYRQAPLGMMLASVYSELSIFFFIGSIHGLQKKMTKIHGGIVF